jgi:chromosome segregation ATPase
MVLFYSILECYQRSEKCPICKRQHNERSSQLYRRLFFSNIDEGRSEADHALIQSLKDKVERLETNLRNCALSQSSPELSSQYIELSLDYEAKDSELIEAVSNLSLATVANKKLEEANLALQASLSQTRIEIVRIQRAKESLEGLLNKALGQLTKSNSDPMMSYEHMRSLNNTQNANLVRKEQQVTLQLAKAEEELTAHKARITDLEAECKVLASKYNQVRVQNTLLTSSLSGRLVDTNQQTVHELEILALETELVSIKRQRNRHHREVTKQKKRVDALEKQTEEMTQIIDILDTLIEKGGLHILDRPSSSRNQARANHQPALNNNSSSLT